MFDQLFNDPLGYLYQIALMIVPFLYGIILHELAHGWVALRLGDPTAKMAGRLTLRPGPHIDPMGAVIFILAHIGWAKPVPVNPRFFKNPRQGMVLVSIAGPAANFIQAAAWALLFHWLMTLRAGNGFMVEAILIVRQVAYFGVFINLLLGCFNLLPIPPMDGSNIVAGFLPMRMARPYMSLARYGMVLVILLAVLGVLSKILIPPIRLGLGLLGLPVYF